MTNASDDKPDLGNNAPILGWVQLLLVIGVLAAAIMLNRFMSGGDESAPKTYRADAAATVSVIIPRAEAQTVSAKTTGTVQPRTTVNIAPQVSGRVVSASPKLVAGGAFAAGEVLFVIETTDYDAAIQQARADLDNASNALLLERAEAETARREWALVNPDQAIPALVARQPQIAQAKAAVRNARARLTTAQANLQRTQLSFPFAGRVLSTTVDVGQTLMQNQAYGSVYRADELELRAELPQREINLLAPIKGREVRLQRQGQQTTSAAKVNRLEEQIDRNTQLGVIAIGLPVSGDWRPGMFAEVEVFGNRYNNAFAISESLLNPDGTVWRVVDGALDRFTPVLLGKSDGMVQVKSFNVGQGLVETAPAAAQVGMAVQLASKPAAGASQ